MFSHKRVERIKKASRSTSVTKFRLWVQLNFPMGTLDTNYLRLALTMGETGAIHQQENFCSLWLLPQTVKLLCFILQKVCYLLLSQKWG